jgi:hypothetical protein
LKTNFDSNQVAKIKSMLEDRGYSDEPSVTLIEPEVRTGTQYAMLGSLRKSILAQEEK